MQVTNFRTKFVETPDGRYGVDTGNGSFDGTVGVLQRKEAMVGINGLAVTASRAGAADPLSPLGSFVYGISRYDFRLSKSLFLYRGGLLYKEDDGSDNLVHWNVYLSPLKWPSWLVSMIFVIGSTLVHVFTSEDSRWIEGLHSFLVQGCPSQPVNVSSRITFLVMFVCGMLVWLHHSAALTSFLAAKLQKPPFLTLEEMLSRTNFKVVTEKSLVFASYFKVFSFYMWRFKE